MFCGCRCETKLLIIFDVRKIDEIGTIVLRTTSRRPVPKWEMGASWSAKILLVSELCTGGRGAGGCWQRWRSVDSGGDGFVFGAEEIFQAGVEAEFAETQDEGELQGAKK